MTSSCLNPASETSFYISHSVRPSAFEPNDSIVQTPNRKARELPPSNLLLSRVGMNDMRLVKVETLDVRIPASSQPGRGTRFASDIDQHFCTFMQVIPGANSRGSSLRRSHSHLPGRS